jgi:hypothetical protein
MAQNREVAPDADGWITRNKVSRDVWTVQWKVPREEGEAGILKPMLSTRHN